MRVDVERVLMHNAGKKRNQHGEMIETTRLLCWTSGKAREGAGAPQPSWLSLWQWLSASQKAPAVMMESSRCSVRLSKHLFCEHVAIPALASLETCLLVLALPLRSGPKCECGSPSPSRPPTRVCLVIFLCPGMLRVGQVAGLLGG